MIQLLSQERRANASNESCQHIEGGEEAIASQQVDEVSVASAELTQYLEQQAFQVAPESSQEVPANLQSAVNKTVNDFLDSSQILVEQAFQMGQTLLRMKTDLKRQDYKILLEQIGWSSTKANKYAKLAEVFEGFVIEQVRQLELNTLFTLCQKTFADVVQKLRSLPRINQAQIEQMIKEARPQRAPTQQPTSGWKQMPSGGGRYYNLLLHDEETGVLIENQAQAEGLTQQHIVKEAVTLRANTKEQKAQQNSVWTEIDAQKINDSQTWAEIEQVVACERHRFASAVKLFSEESKQKLVHTLALHLQQQPEKLRSLVWLPVRLVLAALEKANFVPVEAIVPKKAAIALSYDPYARGWKACNQNWQAIQSANKNLRQ